MQESHEIADNELLCPECEYNLTGSTSDRCPWCGWEIDVDELVAANVSRHTATRISVAGAAFIVSIAIAIGVMALFRRGRQLEWRDALALLTVLVVSVAHFSLAVVILRAPRRWPMRAGEASNIFRMIGWGAIVAGVVAATPILQAAPSPLVVKGVQVNGVLEFVMTAVFFAMPGTMLLVLRLVSYRHKGQKSWLLRARTSSSNRAPFLFEVDQPYAVEGMSQSWSDAPRPTTPSVEEMIARTWEVEAAVAREEGRSLFSGKVGRLIGVQVSQGALHFHLGETCYRDFLGTNLFHAAEIARLNPAYLADALGISAMVLTRDGFLVLGRRSRKVVFHAEHLHTFGGLLEQADHTSEGYDLAGSVRRELMEELGISSADISAMTITGLVRDRAILQPELIFDVHIRLARSEMISAFAKNRDDEHTAIEFVADDPDAVLAFLRNASKVTPVAQAAILLHGKHTWGTVWYEKACINLFGCHPVAGHPERSEGAAPTTT